MKVVKQYITMICVLALSFSVSLGVPQDIKKQAFGRALYDRTCDMVDDNGTQRSVDQLAQKIASDEEVYLLVTLGKKEGYTAADLFECAKRMAQENEDPEVAQVLDSVQQEFSKSWFAKHPFMVFGMIAGGIIAYLKKEVVMNLIGSFFETLGLKRIQAPLGNPPAPTDSEIPTNLEIPENPPVPTNLEIPGNPIGDLAEKAKEEVARLEAERLAAEQEAQRVVEQKAKAAADKLAKEKEKLEKRHKKDKKKKKEEARLAAEKLEAEKLALEESAFDKATADKQEGMEEMWNKDVLKPKMEEVAADLVKHGIELPGHHTEKSSFFDTAKGFLKDKLSFFNSDVKSDVTEEKQKNWRATRGTEELELSEDSKTAADEYSYEDFRDNPLLGLEKIIANENKQEISMKDWVREHREAEVKVENPKEPKPSLESSDDEMTGLSPETIKSVGDFAIQYASTPEEAKKAEKRMHKALEKLEAKKEARAKFAAEYEEREEKKLAAEIELTDEQENMIAEALEKLEQTETEETKSVELAVHLQKTKEEAKKIAEEIGLEKKALMLEAEVGIAKLPEVVEKKQLQEILEDIRALDSADKKTNVEKLESIEEKIVSLIEDVGIDSGDDELKEFVAQYNEKIEEDYKKVVAAMEKQYKETSSTEAEEKVEAALDAIQEERETIDVTLQANSSAVTHDPSLFI